MRDSFVTAACVQVHTAAEYLEMLDAKGYLRSKFVHSNKEDTQLDATITVY
jgi:hypothetical protein